jgi:hypothetical protein
LTHTAQRYYTTADLRAILDISITTIDAWVMSGRLPQPVRPGGPRGKRYWPVEQIESLLAELNSGKSASAE